MSKPRLDKKAVITDVIFISVFFLLIAGALYLASEMFKPGNGETGTLETMIMNLAGINDETEVIHESGVIDPETADEIRLYDISGKVIVNDQYETLLVIHGRAENTSPAPLFSITLIARLQSTDGSIVGEKTFYAGTDMSEKDIITASRSVHSYLSNRENASAEPDESVPFMIIFDNLPDSLKEFTVEVVGAAR